MEQKNTNRWTNMNVSLIVTCSIVGLLVVFGIIMPVVQTLVYRPEGRSLQVTAVETTNRDRVKHQAEELGKIEGPAHWINQGKDIVSIPIDQAMKMYVERERATRNVSP